MATGYSLSPSSQYLVDAGGTISFEIYRTDTSSAETVYVSTLENRGSSNQSDFAALSNLAVSFAAGSGVASFSITTFADTTYELPESFGIAVQSAPGQPVSDYLAQGSFTLLNDDGTPSTGAPSNSNDILYAGALLQSLDGLGGLNTLTLDYSTAVIGTDPVYLVQMSKGTGDDRSLSYFYDGTWRTIDIRNFQYFNLTGTDGEDKLYATSAGSRLIGLDGDDELFGGGSADVLDGGEGNDTFRDIAYGDKIEGGDGIDNLYFDLSNDGGNKVINLFTGSAPGGVWTGIEFIGGSLGSGYDTVIVGAQIHDINGGGGIDTLVTDYSDTSIGSDPIYVVSMSEGDPDTHSLSYFYDSTWRTPTFTSFEKLNITATAGDDRLYGASDANTLIGLAGNDQIFAGGGRDVLDGGEGDDVFQRVGYGDTVMGGDGVDNLYFDYSGVGGNKIINIRTGEVSGSSWTGIEFIGGFTGDSYDTVTVGAQIHDIDGGGGIDTLITDYSSTSIGTDPIYVISMSEGSDDTYSLSYFYDSTWRTPTFTSFEKLNITATAGDDRLYGASGANTLIGLGGNDEIYAGGGQDLLDGGAGDDVFHRVGYADTVLGGDGVDNLYFDYSGVGGNKTINILTGQVPLATWAGIEFIGGFTGDSYDNVTVAAQIHDIDGGGGIDTLNADYSDGFIGSDPIYQIRMSQGADNVRSVSYYYDGTWRTPTIRNFEKLNITATSGDDLLYGTTGGSHLRGLAGNDDIHGDAGADTLDGGSGNDTLRGGDGSDIAVFAGPRIAYTIDGSSGSDLTVTSTAEGTDRLYDMEVLRFADGDYTWNAGAGSIQPTGNVLPVFTAPPPVVEAGAGQSVLISVAASDGNGDSVSFTASDPEHGSVSEASEGEFTYTPDPGFAGTDDFDIVASDGNGGTSTQTIVVTVAAPGFRLFTADGYSGIIGGTGSVFGTNLFQSMELIGAPDHVSFDPSFNRGVDIITLPGDAGDYTIQRLGSSALLIDGASRYTIPVGSQPGVIRFADGVRALYFDTITRLMVIGDQPFGAEAETIVALPDGTPLPTGEVPDASARAFLEPGAHVSVGGDITVFGTTGGMEEVTFISGDVTLDPSFNRGGDTLHLPGPPQDYEAYRLGSSVAIASDDGTVLVPVGSAGMTLDFGGIERVLIYDTVSREIRIGDQAITGTSPDDAIAIEGGALIVSIDQGTLADSVQIQLDGALAYVLTDDANQTSNVRITGFSDDDVLQITGAVADDYSFSSSDSDDDGIADDLLLSWSPGDAANDIVFIDAVSPADFISDLASAELAMGWNFVTFA